MLFSISYSVLCNIDDDEDINEKLPFSDKFGT